MILVGEGDTVRLLDFNGVIEIKGCTVRLIADSDGFYYIIISSTHS